MSLIPAAPANRVTIDYHADVRYFGAVGDGLTDDTAAFESAISAAEGGGGVVVIPDGIYAVNLTILCKNTAFKGSSSYGGYGTPKCALVPYDRTLPVVSIGAANGQTRAYGNSFENLVLWSRGREYTEEGDNRDFEGQYGIRLNGGCYRNSFYGLRIYGFREAGLHSDPDVVGGLYPVSYVYFDDVHIEAHTQGLGDCIRFVYPTINASMWITETSFSNFNLSQSSMASSGYALNNAGCTLKMVNGWIQSAPNHSIRLAMAGTVAPKLYWQNVSVEAKNATYPSGAGAVSIFLDGIAATNLWLANYIAGTWSASGNASFSGTTVDLAYLATALPYVTQASYLAVNGRLGMGLATEAGMNPANWTNFQYLDGAGSFNWIDRNGKFYFRDAGGMQKLYLNKSDANTTFLTLTSATGSCNWVISTAGHSYLMSATVAAGHLASSGWSKCVSWGHDGSAAGQVLGFYGATPAVKPTVSGATGGNAALQSLVAALATLGLVTNSTT